MTDNMELIKHDYCFTTVLMNNIDIVLPHITADTYDGICAFLAPPSKESTKRILVSVGATPNESFSLQIIDIGMVGMSPLSAYLINANEAHMLVVLPCSSIVHSSLNRASYCVPGAIEKPGHLIPRQQSGPETQYSDKRKTDRFLTHTPRNMFNTNTMLRTSDPSRAVVKKHWYAPKGYMTPTPFLELILYMNPFPTNTTG